MPKIRVLIVDDAVVFRRLVAEELSADPAIEVVGTAANGKIALALLNPAQRALGPIYLAQLQGAVIGAPLPLGQSLMIAWPQIVGLIAGMIILFTIGYIVFQRQEVRA